MKTRFFVDFPFTFATFFGGEHKVLYAGKNPPVIKMPNQLSSS